MTDLQVRYQQLEETKRANRAAEEIKAREATSRETEAQTSRLEAEMKAAKIPYEVQNLIAESNLKDSQRNQVREAILKLRAEVENINQDTRLTRYQADQKFQELLQGAARQIEGIIGRVTDITGLSGFTADLLDGVAGGFLGAIGQGGAAALIG